MKAENRDMFIWSIVILILSQVSGLVKFKTLNCELLDKEIGEFVQCRIKALNRYTNMLQIHFMLKKNVNDLVVHAKFMRKLNGWHPFLYNKIIVDVCDFFRNRKKQFLANLIYNYGRSYTNANHTCPYEAGEDIVLHNAVVPETDLLRKYPIDMGEYGLFAKFYINNKLTGVLNGSATFSDI